MGMEMQMVHIFLQDSALLFLSLRIGMGLIIGLPLIPKET